jgi:hypothetical protein
VGQDKNDGSYKARQQADKQGNKGEQQYQRDRTRTRKRQGKATNQARQADGGDGGTEARYCRRAADGGMFLWSPRLGFG